MSRRFRPLDSPARQAIGWLLIVFGVVELALFGLFLQGLGGRYTERGEELADHISLLGIVGPFVTGAVLLVGGLVLREGRKYSVLFLRPFRSMANEKAMRAFSGRLGRRFIVVALDDGVIPTPGYSLLRLLVSVFVLAPSACVLFVVGALAMPMDSYGAQGNHLPSIVVLAFAIVLMRAAWSGARQRRERPSVETQWGLERTVLKVRALSTWGLRAMSPRVVIVKTSDTMWKPAVAAIGGVSDCAIIDVSRSSESIDWEVSFLRETKPTRSLVIASARSSATLPQCEFAGTIETYADDRVLDSDFERRVRARLEEMLGDERPEGADR